MLTPVNETKTDSTSAPERVSYDASAESGGDYSIRNTPRIGHPAKFGKQAPAPAAEAKPEGTAEATPEATPAVTPGTLEDAESRRLFIQAQKAERKANELLKQAKSKTDRFDQIMDAVEKLKDDPYALVDALELPREGYLDGLVRREITHVQAEANPLAEELSKVKAQLDHYDKQLQDERNQRLTLEEQAQVSQYISSQVVPLIDGKPEFEGLIAAHNGNAAQAAQEVFNMQYSLYQDANRLDPEAQPQDLSAIALHLDQFHTTNLQAAIIETLKQKRFAEFVGQHLSQNANSVTHQPDVNAPIERPETVSKPKLPPGTFQAPQKKANVAAMSREQYLDFVLSR